MYCKITEKQKDKPKGLWDSNLSAWARLRQTIKWRSVLLTFLINYLLSLFSCLSGPLFVRTIACCVGGFRSYGQHAETPTTSSKRLLKQRPACERFVSVKTKYESSLGFKPMYFACYTCEHTIQTAAKNTQKEHRKMQAHSKSVLLSTK